MIEAWTADEIRAAEKPLLDAGTPLMDRAARALARTALADVARRRSAGSSPRLRLAGALGSDGVPGPGRVRPPRRHGVSRNAAHGARAVLLVGAGNNGGDALFAGAHLARSGMRVTAFLVASAVHAEGLAALEAAGGEVIARSELRVPVVVEQVAAADVVLDGLVGVGSRGALRPPSGGIVRALVESRAAAEATGAPWPWVIAVDVPSGIGVDDGSVPGPVLPADRTLTFGAHKPGLLLPPAAHVAGVVEVADVGLGAAQGPQVPGTLRMEEADAAAVLRVPGVRDHKYTRGVVGVVAGTEKYPGAGVLVAAGAVRSGAGMVRALGPTTVTDRILTRHPEVVTAGGRVQSWVLGPGIPSDGSDAGQDRRVYGALAAVTGVLDAEVTGGVVPAVIDAGAMAMLEHRLPEIAVLTPHAGELAELMRGLGHEVDRADIEAEPVRWARAAQRATGATVLLKGAVTVIVGSGVTFAQAEAPAWLATAGAGDVLAGLLGTLLAARADDVLADPSLTSRVAAAAVVLHGRAGALASGGGPVSATDVADALPRVIADVLAR
ncbi:bifunctional ADP-dependent NAD(P)H-hydrate dehydratase/NAD(P)H-hydrate epimerase [Myceligenerans pegani]|uniref:Bifunctional NAD(P)H-hydrate repair enzyme n=1 Tax=Myceligenerans pegani TaxID=2776917 RepID=A0ABR9MTD1_9MICO|nr:bifunctional ADP-dependent NAD(P)H-hydrate dehydratase/NAD(P)H-hydrate epimerase [Myceligenerans sp. TRM 65318]MBE1874316.1 bifunctional ADP-dependent NAD(P)H-hydrate dehydratase/NAD(P)H-hydrate epimerase [Myceligenerans sp. TRM 65318]MBE3016587.1 bifunctional ADP-dependent NAD(P)H-hydrate dehydratase/NAD(P)H-hydrate epimerase [Myceligenerans sp. TRM 65318]